MAEVGQIVILNGVSRAGKSSIAALMQERLAGVWINLGMDLHIKATPPAYLPGVGLRPREPGPAPPVPGRVPVETLEDRLPVLYAALYESMAAHARLGLNVVADIYHHDFYSKPLGILADCALRLRGLPVLFVGVLCQVETIWERRAATWGQVRSEATPDVTAAVELGQRAARAHRYDLEVDTSQLSPSTCVEAIRTRLETGPPGSVFAELARASGSAGEGDAV